MEERRSTAAAVSVDASSQASRIIATAQTLARILVIESRSIGGTAVWPRKVQSALIFCRRFSGGEVITSRRNSMFGCSLTALTISCCIPHGSSLLGVSTWATGPEHWG